MCCHTTPLRAGTILLKSVITKCKSARARRRKALYVAMENRTFLIWGNLTDTGAHGPPTECTSSAGENGDNLVSPMMGIMFQDAGCVGEGSNIPFEVRKTKVGRAVHAVYGGLGKASEDDNPMPGHEWPAMVVVDELEGAEHFIPVSIEVTAYRYSPKHAITYTVGGAYSDWDSSEDPIPADEWAIPSVCYEEASTETSKGRDKGAKRGWADWRRWWW